MSLNIVAPVALLLLLCPLVSAVDETCANGKCDQDDYTSLMQTKQKVQAQGLKRLQALGPIGSSANSMTCGNEFTCARSQLYISCWGDNSAGQLGVGDKTSTNQPAAAANFISMNNTQVVAGAYHTCTIYAGDAQGDNAGKVKCWGKNTKGQLGYENTDEILTPPSGFVDLGTGVTASQLAVGDEHTCAITLPNKQVKCWGRGDWGQIGNENSQNVGDGTNEMGSYLSEISIGGSRWAKMIAAGAHHTCVHMDNDEVKCWGLNGNGQLGQGQYTTNNRGQASNQMGDDLPAVQLGADASGNALSAKLVFAGGYHTCVIMNNNRTKCWGRNDFGQLGYGNTASLPNIGVASGQMGAALGTVFLGYKTGSTSEHLIVKTMALGGLHSCAVLGDSSGNNDKVKCWGANSKGQLGYGNIRGLGDGAGEMEGLGAVSLGKGQWATEMSCGYQFTCAILNNNDMKCWGSNAKGQLGNGGTTDLGTGANQMSGNLGPVAGPTTTTAAP